jgi:hypothetical protein
MGAVVVHRPTVAYGPYGDAMQADRALVSVVALAHVRDKLRSS